MSNLIEINKTIEQYGKDFIELLTLKNTAYKNNLFEAKNFTTESTPERKILEALNTKINRLSPDAVRDNDIADIAGYCLLLLVARKSEYLKSEIESMKGEE